MTGIVIPLSRNLHTIRHILWYDEIMPEDHLKPQDSATGGSSSNGGGDATGGTGDETLPATTAAPIDNVSNTGFFEPIDTGGTAEGTGGQQAEGRGRDLSKKLPEQTAEPTPEELRTQELQRRITQAVTRYGLNEKEKQNLEVSLSQPGIDVTQELVTNKIQAIAPDKLAMTQFKEKFGASMAHVAETGLSYLAPSVANFAKQQSAASINTLTA